MALEALAEQEPLHEIAKRHGVHSNQISQWKKELRGNLAAVFARKTDRESEKIRQRQKEDRPYRQVGQIQMEVDFFKGCSGKSVGKRTGCRVP